MEMLSIKLFGGLSVQGSHASFSNFRSLKAASLLAYLAARPCPQNRETLIEMIWPDATMETGRHNLSNALSVLRNLLGSIGVRPETVIQADRTSVFVNPLAVATDVRTFEAELLNARKEGKSPDEKLSHWERGAAVYSGPLLPGFYEDWVSAEALRWESLFLKTVEDLVPMLLMAGRPEEAVNYAQRAVATDPLSEKAALGLMRALSAMDQPALVVRTYRTLAQRLKDDLDIQPSDHLRSEMGNLGYGTAYSRGINENFLCPPCTDDVQSAQPNSYRACQNIEKMKPTEQRWLAT